MLDWKEKCKQLDGGVVSGAPVVLTAFAAAQGGNRLPVCSPRALLASRYYAGHALPAVRDAASLSLQKDTPYRNIPLHIFIQGHERRLRGSNAKPRSLEGRF